MSDSAEDLDGLREEYFMLQTPGYQRRAARMLARYQGYSDKLTLGLVEPHDPEALRLQGRCKEIKELFEVDKAVEAAWEAHVRPPEEENLPDEGGPVAPAYEAAG
jgi:hypothetical protein